MGGKASAEAREEKSADHILVNVYEPSGSRFSMPGLGIYHSGVEIYGSEYTFAGNGTRSTGVFTHRPRNPPLGESKEEGWQFKQAVDLGPCQYPKQDVKEMVTYLSSQFPGNSYHLTSRNCNHFSEAFCTQLGVTFPSWINRAARAGEAVRGVVGDSALTSQAPAPVSPAPAPGAAAATAKGPSNIGQVAAAGEMFTPQNVDFSAVTCLNVSDDYAVSATFPSSPASTFVQSDCDEQLLVSIPFRQPVKLTAIGLSVPSETEWTMAPKQVKLFKNQSNLDFSDVEDAVPTASFEISAQRIVGQKGSTMVYQEVSPGRFRDVASLAIFIESNHGAGVSRLYSVSLVGLSKEGLDMTNLQKSGGG